jgi:hypothetical protein
MTEAPRMYDVTVDEWRAVTQQDADNWAMYQQGIGHYLRGQDLLRAAYRSVCTKQLTWQDFNKALNDFQEKTGVSLRGNF